MLRRTDAPPSNADPAPRAGGLAARLPFHYSWIVIAILATVQIFASSISMAAGIMVPPLSDPEGAFGWNKSLVGLGIAAYYGFGAIYAPFTGWLGDRFGSRIMLAAAAVMYLISMILLSQIREVWHFFLFFGVLLSLTQSLGMVPLMASVTGWFRRRLGLGIGILWAAGGIGTAAFAPLAGFLIETLDWQNTFLIIGLIGGIAMLCLVPLMRNRPSDLGIEPYGTRPGDATTARLGKGLEQLRIKVFNQHIRRTKPFWNLPLIHGLGCAGHGIIIIYVALLALEREVFTSLLSAGFILAIISLVSIISRFVTPVLAEIYGTRRMMALSLSIQGLTVLILFWAQDAWVFYLFAGHLRDRLRRRVDRLSDNQPSVFRRWADGHSLRLADHRRSDGPLRGHLPGWPGALRHRLLHRHPHPVHGLQPWRRGDNRAAGQQHPRAHTRLGERTP